jgi:EAL domain-containing protein (putative c-di-GMP-specific phosphodiesterase class I)
MHGSSSIDRARPTGPLLRAVVALLAEAAVVTSAQGVVLEVNDAFCRLAGFRREALLGHMLPLLGGIPSATGPDVRDVAAPANWMASVAVVCADGSHANVVASIARVEPDADDSGTLLIRIPHRLRLRGATHTKRHVRSEIELAAERGEFFARYQPIVSLRHGHIEAFEALLRWQHPVHGIVGTGAFIGEAESRGVLSDITRMIVHDACHDAAHWNDIRPGGRPISVSVNLCGSQLRDPRLIDSIADALATSGLAPSLLWLEITENSGITEAARDPELLHDLRRIGSKLVLDDFGIGYASLGSVRSLPLDILKFDRSLVAGAAENRCDARILAAGIEMGQALEIDVIAEGIENRAQLEYLQTLECASGQGYYFSRPIDRERADLLVATAPNWLDDATAWLADVHAITQKPG